MTRTPTSGIPAIAVIQNINSVKVLFYQTFLTQSLAPVKMLHNMIEKEDVKEAGYGCLGVGCFAAIAELFIASIFGGFPILGCLGCAGLLLLIGGSIYILRVFSSVILIAFIFLPSIIMGVRWLRFNNEPDYQSIEKLFCRAIKSKPTKDPTIEVLLSFVIASAIQLFFYALIVLIRSA